MHHTVDLQARSALLECQVVRRRGDDYENAMRVPLCAIEPSIACVESAIAQFLAQYWDCGVKPAVAEWPR